MDDIERRLRDDASVIERALEPESPPDRDTATAPGWRRWALAAAAIPLIGLVVAAGVIVSNLGDEDRVEPDVPRATKASVEPTEPPSSTVPADAGLLRVTQRPTECCNESGQVSRLVVRDGQGRAVANRAFISLNPLEPVLELALPVGRYQIRSFQQPCSGSCDDLRDAESRCRDTFDVELGQRVDLAVEFAPGEPCRVVATDPMVWPVPVEFADREPYRSCGVSFALDAEDLQVPSDEECFRKAAQAGEPAELTMYAAGDDPSAPDLLVYRSNRDRTIEVFKANVGRRADGPWQRWTCDRLVDDDIGELRFEGCESPTDLVTAKGATAPPPTVRAEPVVAQFSVAYGYDYSETNTSSCPVASTSFVDRSRGAPTSWEWKFPDGTTSNEQHPRLPIGVSGDITLTVSNGTSTDRTSGDVGYVEC